MKVFTPRRDNIKRPMWWHYKYLMGSTELGYWLAVVADINVVMGGGKVAIRSARAQ